MQEMFSQMVEAKDISKVEKYYDPDFLLYTNGQVQDYSAFHAVMRGYPAEISYAVEDATRIEVIFLAATGRGVSIGCGS